MFSADLFAFISNFLPLLVWYGMRGGKLYHPRWAILFFFLAPLLFSLAFNACEWRRLIWVPFQWCCANVVFLHNVTIAFYWQITWVIHPPLADDRGHLDQPDRLCLNSVMFLAIPLISNGNGQNLASHLNLWRDPWLRISFELCVQC